MMGEPVGRQDPLFYEFDLEDMVPGDHLLRRIDAALDLSWLRGEMKAHYSPLGCPSICPELMVRMLIVGYCYSIRSERRLCQEVKVNLAYRWFCGLGLEDKVPHHSTFSANRLGRFRKSDILRKVFEEVVCGGMTAGLVGGEGFAVDASVIEANASRFQRVEGAEVDWTAGQQASRPVSEYLAGDVAYGTGEMLGWLVAHGIDPHIPVWDRGKREKGAFSRADFAYDEARDLYLCPAGKPMKTTGRLHSDGYYRYAASKRDCDICPLKPRCCPTQPERRVPRAPDEAAREYTRALMESEAYAASSGERKKIEALFGEAKHILGLTRLRLRGLIGARDEFLLAATVQNLKRLANHTTRPPPQPVMA